MFKKLREKVVAESPEKDGSLSPSMRRSSMPGTSHGRQSQRGMPKAESVSSFSTATEYSASMSKEDLLSTLMQKTTQMKRMENRLSDYVQSLKELSRDRDKLTIVLEKQQDTALQRMAELEETFKEGKTKMEKTISKLEKREVELVATVEELETENKKLHESVHKWEQEKEDFVKKRDQFFASRDSSEELQDLQRQEMAKLKHMLMRSEKEWEKCRGELDQNLAELLQCQDKNEDLELSLQKTTESLNTAREQLEIKVQQLEKKGSKVKSLDNSLTEMKSQNSDLEIKLKSLSAELSKCQSSLSTLEFSYTEVTEKYESLKHSSEAVMKKATVNLDEKDGTIDHLKKKISSLEQRMTTDKLPENEQVQVLTAERNSLENRLEESHLQLSNIKSTWSTKINQLEQQVSNLNAKIAEDSRELSTKEETISQLETSHTETVENLKKKLKDAEVEIEKGAEQNEIYVNQVTKLEADAIELKAHFDLEKTKLTSALEKMRSKMTTIESNLKEEIRLLQESSDQYQDKIKELEIDIAKHEREKKARDKSMEEVQSSFEVTKAECESLQDANKHLTDRLQETEKSLSTSKTNCDEFKAQLATLNDQLSTTRSDFDTVSKELEQASSNIESLQQEISEIKKELSAAQELSNTKQQEISDLGEKIDEMKVSLLSREEELMNSKQELATLRNTQAEGEETISTLETEKIKFEEKVAERERTIKVQQQRLTDLKKALNKELGKRSSGAAGSYAGTRTASPARSLQSNGLGSTSSLNGSHEGVPDMSGIGTMAIDDPNLSAEQREINAKYLKHVILTFLGSNQSEAQQLIKAMSMLLNFNKDEEKFVKQTVEYRASWFGSKPSTKKVASSVVKQRKR